MNKIEFRLGDILEDVKLGESKPYKEFRYIKETDEYIEGILTDGIKVRYEVL